MIIINNYGTLVSGDEMYLAVGTVLVLFVVVSFIIMAVNYA